MRFIHSKQVLAVPDDIEIKLENRVVTVKGKFGTIKKSFRHAEVDMTLAEDNKSILVQMWFATPKQKATIRTICSHISNMFTGVTKKFQYKMRLVYSHFPININVVNDGKTVEIRNFLGEKIVRSIQMLNEVKIIKDSTVKDQLVLQGVDIELVSRSAALVHQSVLVKNKDIRKFLDGIYVSETGTMEVAN
eukprot:Platyproteum_vivax@DN3083_c0_g1_i3.p1